MQSQKTPLWHKRTSLIFAVTPFVVFSSPSWASWAKQPNDNLKMELGVSSPRYNFEIKAPKELSLKTVKLEPHSPSKTTLGFSYRNLGVSVASTNPTSQEENAKYGTSKSTDVQLRFFGKRTYEFFYQSYEGYFIKNSEDLDPTYQGTTAKIIRSDISTTNYGLNFFWSLHDKDFSQAVAFDQAGYQKGSGWGTSWLIHASQSKIFAESAIVPSSVSSEFGRLAEMKRLNRNALATGFGIGGIATVFNFYATAFLGLGIGHQSLLMETASLEELKYSQSGAYVSGRVGLGYNGTRHVFGLQALADSVTSTIEKGEVNGATTEFAVFYAYRFDDVNLPPLNWLSSLLD